MEDGKELFIDAELANMAMDDFDDESGILEDMEDFDDEPKLIEVDLDDFDEDEA
jgi:hypothetical protein